MCQSGDKVVAKNSVMLRKGIEISVTQNIVVYTQLFRSFENDIDQIQVLNARCEDCNVVKENRKPSV